MVRTSDNESSRAITPPAAPDPMTTKSTGSRVWNVTEVGRTTDRKARRLRGAPGDAERHVGDHLEVVLSEGPTGNQRYPVSLVVRPKNLTLSLPSPVLTTK